VTVDGKRVALFVATLAALGCTVACSEPQGAVAGSATLRDSAGISIVESSAPEWAHGSGWMIEPTPVVSIGSAEGAPEYQLTNVGAVVELSDGRIVVADGGSMQLRTYAADGRFIRAVGRRGQGPGEFSQFTAVTRYRGDSIFVHDFPQRRFTVLSVDGRVGRIGSLELPPGARISGEVTVVGTWTDGSIAAIQQPVRTGLHPPQITRRTHTLYRYTATGQFGVLLAAAPGLEYYEATGFLGSMMRLPLGRTTTFITVGDDSFVADNAKFEIRRISARGGISLIIRCAVVPESVTVSDAAAERERLRTARIGERATFYRGMPDSILRRIVATEEETFRDIPFPPTYPAFGAVTADRDGFLWVERYARPGVPTADAKSYAVFAPDGRWLGDVRLPARFTLSSATVDHAIGVETDDLDVQYIRVYRIAGRR
jgi:hypothetical protein